MAPTPARDGTNDPREVETRARNERIAAAARRHHFDYIAPVPFLCECSDPACDALVRVSLGEYDASRLAADFLVSPVHAS